MLTLFVRTVIIYFFLIIAMRIGGKRQIGEMQLSELVSALLLSDLAVNPISRDETPILFGIVPIITVICIEIICAYVSTKSQKAKKLFDGSPSFIINRGKLDLAELSRLRMSIEELMSEARQKGIGDISDLEYAILEENGKLSVFSKNDASQSCGIAHVIISDGKIVPCGLKALKISKSDLLSRLNTLGTSCERVFLYTVNDSGAENLILRPSSKYKKERGCKE